MGFPTRPSNVRVCQFHHSGTGVDDEEAILGAKGRKCQRAQVVTGEVTRSTS